MVRTSGGIRISAGKSSKKSGGGATSGGGSRSTSTPSGKSSGKGNNRLPPIPHCEAPSWQKPITNFFSSEAGPSKNEETEIVENEGQLECSSKNKENTDDSVKGKKYEKNEISQKDSNNINDDGQLYEKENEEEKDKDDNTSS